MSSLAWMADGLCREVDPEEFFPQSARAAVDPVIKRLCRECPVNAECLDYALANRVEGVWAGTRDQDRDRMRKEAGIRALPVVPLMACGTHQGTLRHLSKGEPPCVICATAETRRAWQREHHVPYPRHGRVDGKRERGAS